MNLVGQLAPYETEVAGAPNAEFTVAPPSVEDAARILDLACERGLRVLTWGGGTHQGYGYGVDPDVVLSTHRLDRLIDWSPDDLVAVVEAGVKVSTLEERLAEKGQSAILSEIPGGATVGGSIAAGISGWRRLRYGPIRDRILEATVATGDGRVIRAGGRVVKNATGYDIPRLMTGSLGSLGVIGSVALKLWPVALHAATVTVEDPTLALATAYRPIAVLETNSASAVYLSGTDEALDEQIASLDGTRADGHLWPDPLDHNTVLVMRVPSRHTSAAVNQVEDSWDFCAAHGVGEIRIGSNTASSDDANRLRQWAEAHNGALVVERLADDLRSGFDPWGTPPATAGLQRRVKDAFDPVGVCNPGKLPGGV